MMNKAKMIQSEILKFLSEYLYGYETLSVCCHPAVLFDSKEFNGYDAIINIENDKYHETYHMKVLGIDEIRWTFGETFIFDDWKNKLGEELSKDKESIKIRDYNDVLNKYFGTLMRCIYTLDGENYVACFDYPDYAGQIRITCDDNNAKAEIKYTSDSKLTIEGKAYDVLPIVRYHIMSCLDKDTKKQYKLYK